MKKIIAAALIGTMCLSLAACGGTANGGGGADANAGGAQGGVTLSIMGNANDLAKPYMTKMFDLYEQKTGNKLDIVSIEASTFDTVATSKFATGDIPDVFVHFNNSSLSNYDVANNFYYMNDEAWVSDLTDGAHSYVLDAQGNVLGLPFWESSVSGCYYNKTLFDELGLKPATTQAEFDQLCQALTDAGKTAICWPANGCNWMYQFGLDPIFADDSALLEKINKNEIRYADIPAVADMVQWTKSAADKGWFGASYLTDGWSDISPILGTGEAAMVFIWDTWFYTDFDEGYDYTKDDFALMPVFMNTTNEGTYEGGNLNMMMANKNGGNLDAALSFIAFCATPENYNMAFEGVSTVSCFKGQTTNIQSEMVTAAMDSINQHQRTSTAEPKVIGYTQNETGSAFQELFMGSVDVAGCIELMDQYRMTSAKALGTPGF
ncbi:MAG: extracellular solute-binding protein [Agathobaculum sp.]|uniref:ABC transporter substrate-binding protein n=1 Tax=Agathobaculum sp. TaxID=2048138 RepID=UPI0025B7DCE1|nr:extracellular solute-binding protein [Agathobaculum sp.]MCI7125528.1 extracellular solute-binding protein [Agathobaculum sp.]MDY3712672.1 extracellular solute-binding protein [Agathobaculum sp.]